MTRGWDRFLTARDKEHLAHGFADREPYGLGDRPVVIVVDAYYASVGDERRPLLESIERWPLSCGLEGWAAIDRIAELLTAARAAGLPVVYLRDLPFPDAWAPPGRTAMPDAHRGNEIVAEIAPLPGDLVVEKAAPSGFAGTPLQYHLNHLRADSLIVCGESTSGCVRATVVDAATNRYRVSVVEECCYDRTEAAHWINLFDMAMKYADVVPLGEIMETLRTRRAV